MSPSSVLIESDWRQGVILPRKLVSDDTLPSSVGPDTKLLVISHDCDIVNPSYESEPFVELLIAHPKPEEARNGSLFKGKNPRKIQFFCEESGGARLYEISVHEKFRVDRSILEDGAPDTTIKIGPSDVQVIAKWAARRYTRPSFPTAFVERITNAVRKRFLKKLENDGEDVIAVLVGFETHRELKPDEPYRIVLRTVVTPEACEDDQKEQRALSVSSEIRTLLGQCEGIEVEDANLVSSAEITLDDYNHLTRWDFDYLSPDDQVGAV